MFIFTKGADMYGHDSFLDMIHIYEFKCQFKFNWNSCLELSFNVYSNSSLFAAISIFIVLKGCIIFLWLYF